LRCDVQPGTQANDRSGYYGLSISADGRYVAFLSYAANFTPEDHNGLIDAYLRDRVLATTVRVSLRTFGSEIARGVEQYQLSMPEDASKIVFASRAPDIVDEDSNGFLDLFLRSPLR